MQFQGSLFLTISCNKNQVYRLNNPNLPEKRCGIFFKEASSVPLEHIEASMRITLEKTLRSNLIWLFFVWRSMHNIDNIIDVDAIRQFYSHNILVCEFRHLKRSNRFAESLPDVFDLEYTSFL